MGIISKIKEFASKPKIKETPFNMKNFNINALTKELHLSLFDSALTTPETSIERVGEILKDIDISSVINKIARAVTSNELTIWSDIEENLSLVNEINSRFSQVKFSRVIEYILLQRYYGYSCFEMIYNPDYTLQTLLFIPHKYITYDKSKKQWQIKASSESLEITHDKYLLNIYKYNPENKMGISLFDSINECFTDKVNFRRQLRSISEKYGDTIILFAYDPSADLEKVREQAKELQKMKGKSAIAVPMNTTTSDGKIVPMTSQMHIISLHELEPKIYTELEKIEKEKILQNLLGGTLTMEAGNGTGSYALGSVHEEGFEQVIKECRELVTDSLYKLIEIDAGFFGYNPKEFYFKLEPQRDLQAESELQQKQEMVKATQLDNIIKLKQGVGYTLPTEYIASIFELQEKDLEAYEAPQNPFMEFAKKKSSQLDIREEQWKKYESDFSKVMHKGIKKWLKDPLNTELELDFKLFEDLYLKTYLIGRIDAERDSIKEFAFRNELENIYEMTNDQAIIWAMGKKPELFANIDGKISEVQDTAFWIKRSTELEATKKVNSAIMNSLRTGGTYEDFMKDIESVAAKAGMAEDGWYSRLVYNQNMANAYAAADYEEHVEMMDDYPYWQFDGVGDDRQSDICRSYDGRIYLATDPIWNIMYPPCHFSCRSSVIPLTKDEVEGQKIWKSSEKELNHVKEKAGSFARTPTMKNQVEILEKSCIMREQEIESIKRRMLPELTKELSDMGVTVDLSSFRDLENGWGYDLLSEFRNLSNENPVVKEFSKTHGILVEMAASTHSNPNAVGTYQLYSPGKKNLRLWLDEEKFSNLETFIKNVEVSIREGHAMAVNKESVKNYALIHEWSHLLQDAIINSQHKDELDGLLGDVFSNKRYQIAEEMRMEILLLAAEYDEDIHKNYEQYVSEYGTRSPYEFFAEVSTGLRGGVKNPLTEALKTYLEKFRG